MASVKYTYSVANDTLNGKVAASALKGEICASAIVTAVDYVDVAGDNLDVWMKATLSAGDVTLLGTVVGAHPGVPLLNQSVVMTAYVENENFEALGIDLTYRMKPLLCDIPATEGPHTFTLSFPYPILLLGGHIDLHSAMVGDSLKVETLATTTVGTLAQAASIDDTVIYPSSGAMPYMFKGLDVALNGDEVGRIMAVGASSITLDTALTSAYAAGTTAVAIEYISVEPYYVTAAPLVLWISRDTERGAVIQAGQAMKFYYYNTTQTAKKVQITFEYYS